jgi:GT2 family glycosyltransferase
MNNVRECLITLEPEYIEINVRRMKFLANPFQRSTQLHQPMTDIRVAIIILNWNGLQDTLACLQSLETLRYPADVIVVDNGSSDGSVEMIRIAYPDVELLENKTNLGFGLGNNVGIRYALELGYEYVWLLNNDTLLEAITLGSMVHVAQNNSMVGAVGSVIFDLEPRDHLQVWGGGCINLLTGYSWHLQGPGSPDYLIAASVLLRSEALRQVGLFDPQFFYTWEDVDLCFRLRQAGWRLEVAAESHVWHKETVSVGKHSPTRARMFTTGLVLFMRKHSSLPLLATLLGLGFRLGIGLLRGRWRIIPATLQGWLIGWNS